MQGKNKEKIKIRQNSGIRPCGLPRLLAIVFYDAFAVVALLILAAAIAMAAGFGGLRALRDPVYTFYLLTVWFLYLAWCWHRGGMTVGMRAWHVRIQSKDGGTPGWGQCVIRFLASLLSAAAAGIGFAWSLFDPEKRTWHDILSGTRLVRY